MLKKRRKKREENETRKTHKGDELNEKMLDKKKSFCLDYQFRGCEEKTFNLKDLN